MLTNSELNQIKDYLALYGKKDSQLPSAILPLNVNDKVAILQGGVNKLVTISELVQALEGEITYDICTMTYYENLSEKVLGKLYICTYDDTHTLPSGVTGKSEDYVKQIYLDNKAFLHEDTRFIYDEEQKKYQKEINQEVYNSLNNIEEIKADKSNTYTKEEVDTNINNAVAPKANSADVYTRDDTYTKAEVHNLITTPSQQYVSVETYEELPISGEADTIYRVGGSTSYSEYAWNGTSYIQLSEKEYGIDDTPTAGSDNLVKSGGVYEILNKDTTSIQFQSTIVGDAINYTNGAIIPSSGTNYKHTLEINVQGYSKLLYARIKSVNAVTSVGMAFYTADNQYISGESMILNADSNGYKTSYIDVPNNAKYAIFSLKADNIEDFFVRPVGTKNDIDRLSELNKSIINSTGIIQIKDYDIIENTAIVGSTGERVSSTGFNITDAIFVKGIDKISYSRFCTTSSSSSVGMAFYDKDGFYISGQSAVPNSDVRKYVDSTIDVPSNAVFALFSVYKSLSGFYINLGNPEDILENIHYVRFKEADDSESTTYQDIRPGTTAIPDSWVTTTFSSKILSVPLGSKFVRITPKNNASWVFLLKRSTAPVAGIRAELSDSVSRNLRLELGNSYVFPILTDCTAIGYLATYSGGDCTPIIEFADGLTDLGTRVIEDGCNFFYGNEIIDVEFNDNPETLFNQTDVSASSIAAPVVIKVNENMYYMYYNAVPQGSQGDSESSIVFAYSTDGLNWVHDLPTGIINNNVGGYSNVLLPSKNNQCVVKVPDSNYPYRMLAALWHEKTQIYKSADGINWGNPIREYPYYYDNFPSVVVRGNYMKVYMRRRDGDNREDRYIGIVTLDLDGNVLTPPTIFFGKYLYQAGASPLDDRRDILFSSYYTPLNDNNGNTCFLNCYIVDGNKIYPVKVDFTKITPTENPNYWHYISPGIINIGNDFYIYYTEFNTLHTAPAEDKIRTFKRAKITFKNTGTYWYPQP